MESDINMKIGKFILSFVLSLVLVLGLFILQLSIFTQSKLFNSEMYVAKFEKLNLYGSITTSINNELSTLSRRCNLPKEFFNNSFSEKWVKNEVDNTTKSIVNYMTYKTERLYVINTKSQEAVISTNLTNFIKSSNLTVDEAVETELNKVKSDAVNITTNNICPINIKSIEANSSFNKVRKNMNYLNIYKNYVSIFLIATTILLFLIHIKKINQFVKWLGCSLIAGGLITFIPALIGFSSNFTNNLAINMPIAKIMIGAILKEYIVFFLQSGLLLFSAGLFLLLIASKFKKLAK